MDYSEYDRIQADLGAVGYSYEITCREMLSNSKADEESKELVRNICKATENHLDAVSLLISRTARLMTK